MLDLTTGDKNFKRIFYSIHRCVRKSEISENEKGDGWCIECYEQINRSKELMSPFELHNRGKTHRPINKKMFNILKGNSKKSIIKRLDR